MKLIIAQYLASIRERGELDAIFPDLLSQMGMNVFSRPGRGTRQHGVDVGAVGQTDGGPEKVYLFSIKAGDLTREKWDGNSAQALRPSLNEIIDVYIPNRIPTEHREKNIVICVCLGGNVQEQVVESFRNYLEKHQTDKISFSEWNGDYIAELIQKCFLREDLLPQHARNHLRKAVAMREEPKVSYKNFSDLCKALSNGDISKDAERIRVLRQISICLWILFAWARDAKNIEAAYLSSEIALLNAWEIFKKFAGESGKQAQEAEIAFLSTVYVYHVICAEFLNANVLPHVSKLHAVSRAVRSSCSFDVNLKLFDLLGRLGTAGLWAYWGADRASNEDSNSEEQSVLIAKQYALSIKELVSNNPALLLPVIDEQVIDIYIAAWLLALDGSQEFIGNWMREIFDRAMFAYRAHICYPCNLKAYNELISHPKFGDEEYRKNVTTGSILYPTIALWAALLNDEETYKKISLFKQEYLQHCTFQFWYPDEHSEKYFFTSNNYHGTALCNPCVESSCKDYLEQVLDECKQSNQFNELSAVKYGWWPLIVVACRHHRLPLPLHFLKHLFEK